MNALRRFLVKLAVAILVLVALVVILVYSGVYNMGATAPHSKLVGHTLHLTMRHSVRAHARDVTIPNGIDLRDPALAERAVRGYQAMCRTCHGAPGEKPDEWMTALYPPAPDLTDVEREKQWTDTEVYWIIKNGIKDTGMPAVGATHEDDEVWALTALVRQFLTMSPDQYRAMAERARQQPETGHEHGHEPPPSPQETQPHKH